ncbi:MAG: sialidase family protein [Bacteroidota bacterium]
MKTTSLILLSILLSFPIFNLQGQKINNILLDDTGFLYQPCEPSIAINPKNPDNIVGGAILNKVYYTLDGGKNWTTQKLTSSYGVFGDPCIIADKKGNFYYFHLSDPEHKGWFSKKLLDRIVGQRSSDGGVTWDDGGYMGESHPKDQDKEWAIANPKNGHLYATWTQFDVYDSKDPKDKSNILFSYSKNKGKTWSDAIAINQFSGDCIDDDGTTEGATPAVGPKGEIYVAWALNEKIYFDKSTDKGMSWMEKDIVVADQPGGWTIDIPGLNRSNGMPVLACDVSKADTRGNLYINWADQKHGEEDTDIWLSKSTDGGNSWSAPKRVNDDPPGKQQFLTWMSIDQTTGYIYIVFYDRRNHEGLETDVYIAYSTDGGENFTNVKISEKAFTPGQSPFFGDYNNISAHAGRICPIWTREENARTSVWTAVISEGDLGIK